MRAKNNNGNFRLHKFKTYNNATAVKTQFLFLIHSVLPATK